MEFAAYEKYRNGLTYFRLCKALSLLRLATATLFKGGCWTLDIRPVPLSLNSAQRQSFHVDSGFLSLTHNSEQQHSTSNTHHDVSRLRPATRLHRRRGIPQRLRTRSRRKRSFPHDHSERQYLWSSSKYAKHAASDHLQHTARHSHA